MAALGLRAREREMGLSSPKDLAASAQTVPDKQPTSLEKPLPNSPSICRITDALVTYFEVSAFKWMTLAF